MLKYSRFIETGRLVLIKYGPYEGLCSLLILGKLAYIIDIRDMNRVIVDGGRTTG